MVLIMNINNKAFTLSRSEDSAKAVDNNYNNELMWNKINWLTNSIDGLVEKTDTDSKLSEVEYKSKRFRPTDITDDYTVQLKDEIITIDATAGNIAVTLPTIEKVGRRKFIFKKTDSSANTVTISDTTNKIDGVNTFVLSSQYSGVELYAYVNSATSVKTWYVISKYL